MKSKKVITLTLNDLKDLGIIDRKKKRKKHKKRKQKILLVDPNTGAVIGGAKSDSSHMKGSGMILPAQPAQLTNTSTVGSAIQQADLEAKERQNRFNKERDRLALTNGVDESSVDPEQTRFNNMMLPYIKRQQEDLDKVKSVLNRGIAEFYDLQQDYQVNKPSKIIELNYEENDDAGIVSTNSGELVNGGMDKDEDAFVKAISLAPEDPLQTPLANEDILLPDYSQNAYEQYNPQLPIDDDIEDQPTVRMRAKPKTIKPKQRETIFGKPMYLVEEQPQPQPQPSNIPIQPVYQTPIKYEDPEPQPLIKKTKTKTPDNIRQTKQLIEENPNQRMPKGMTAERAIDLYHHYGGADEFVSQMTNPQAIYGQVKKLPKFQKQLNK